MRNLQMQLTALRAWAVVLLCWALGNVALQAQEPVIIIYHPDALHPPVVGPQGVVPPHFSDAVPPQPAAPTEPPPDRPEPCPQPEALKFQDSLTSYTFLPASGDKAFGVQTFASTDRWVDLWGNPAWRIADSEFRCAIDYALHWWEGPDSPDAPPRLYDLYLNLLWHRRWGSVFTTEVGLAPGLSGDFRVTPPDMFRMRGRGVAFLALLEDLQLVGGVTYLDRNKVKALPVAGVLWQPDCNTMLRLVFPYPKAAYRIGSKWEWDYWLYVAGEYGGGAWDFKSDSGASDSVEYDDIRVMAGLECQRFGLAAGLVEVGYVFARRLRYQSFTPEFEPSNTLMLRVGWCY